LLSFFLLRARLCVSGSGSFDLTTAATPDTPSPRPPPRPPTHACISGPVYTADSLLHAIVKPPESERASERERAEERGRAEGRSGRRTGWGRRDVGSHPPTSNLNKSHLLSRIRQIRIQCPEKRRDEKRERVCVREPVRCYNRRRQIDAGREYFITPGSRQRVSDLVHRLRPARRATCAFILPKRGKRTKVSALPPLRSD
jgi:hypothetical protein